MKVRNKKGNPMREERPPSAGGQGCGVTMIVISPPTQEDRTKYCYICGIMRCAAAAPRGRSFSLLDFALLLLVCLLVPTWLSAETISGTILDSSGAVIAG